MNWRTEIFAKLKRVCSATKIAFCFFLFFHFRKKQPLISPVSPEQSFPSPLVLWKPGLHLQWKDPLVLAHMELLPQASDRHSLISVSNKETILLASLFNICLMRRPRVGSPYKSSSLSWINKSIAIYIYLMKSSTIEHFLVDEDFNPFLDDIYIYIYFTEMVLFQLI